MLTPVTAPITLVTSVTPRSRLVTIDLGRRTFQFLAGQVVMVAPHGDPDRKPYSIASSPEDVARTGTLELLIALDGSGTDILERAVPGALLDIEGPMGTFTLPAAPAQRWLLFIAGGTGIAPLRSMIGQALIHCPAHRISVLYSARRSDEFAFIRELRDHATAGRIELHQTVTRDDSTAWSGHRGRIGRAEFEAVVHEPHDTLCFVCGPAAMVSESMSMLEQLGVPDDQIRTERWGK